MLTAFRLITKFLTFINIKIPAKLRPMKCSLIILILAIMKILTFISLSDMHDIVNKKVEIVDENRLVVPATVYAIEFKLEGEGVLIGTENGKP